MLPLRLTILLFLLFFSLVSWGQDCGQKLAQAERTYEAGRLDEIASILGNCFELEESANGFSKSEKQRAYHLLTRTYLYTDQIEEAENTLINLLSVEPEYQINYSSDPAEFVELLRKFRTTPIFSLGVVAGINITNVQVQNVFGLQNTSISQGTYGTQPGFQLGLSADIPLLKFIEFSPEVMLTQQSFTFKNAMFDYTELDMTELQTHLIIPLSFKALLIKGKTRPFVEAGITTSLLFSSEAEVARTFLPNIGEIVEREPQDQTISMFDSNLRKTVNLSYFAGVGVRRKIKRAFISLSVRLGQTLENVVETKNRYSNTDLIYRYGYLDDDFLLRNLQLNFRYLYSIYKPKKLKRKE